MDIGKPLKVHEIELEPIKHPVRAPVERNPLKAPERREVPMKT